MQATPMTSTPLEGPGGQASPKEKYELLYGSMKDYYAGLVDFEYKHAGFLARMAGGVTQGYTICQIAGMHFARREIGQGQNPPGVTCSSTR